MPIAAATLNSEPLWVKPQGFQQAIDSELQHWLLDKSSLTAKLVEKSNQQLRVEVLRQRIQAIRRSEQNILRIKHRQWAVVREVILYGNNAPWVYARTVIPLTTVHGSLRHLHYLGNKPLGHQLFNHPNMLREPIEIAEFLPQHLPNAITQKFNQFHSCDLGIWGRRSIFRLSKKPLLVCEIFLPNLLT